MTHPAPPIQRTRKWHLLGPAFIAAVAYVDPGNVAANISAGAKFGYLLVWVLVLANIMAMFVQYQAAKLGVVYGKTLPELLSAKLPKKARIGYWVQAELVAAATDLAEVIGGALALYLLFGTPLLLGGVIIGIVSMGLLLIQGPAQRQFERVVIAMLAVITFGFLAGLVERPPSATGILHGMVPQFAGQESIALAASMLGATVMPHVIYLHSSLVIHHHGTNDTASWKRKILKANRWDIGLALTIASLVNIGLLLLAASALAGRSGTDSIEGAHAAIVEALGPGIGMIFAVGLLFSGLASTSVGAYAGSEVMKGMLQITVPLWLRRLITLVPALIILGLGINPTTALVISQIFLSFGIPFALIPLQYFTGRKQLGQFQDACWVRWAGWSIVALIIALNLLLLVLSI